MNSTESPTDRPTLLTFASGDRSETALLNREIGHKALALAEMARLDAPVPPGVVLTAALCELYVSNRESFPEGVETAIGAQIAALAEWDGAAGRRFGDAGHPMLVSLRASPVAHVHQSWRTVFNLGINGEIAKGLAARSGDGRFAWDCYRRFLRSFGEQVSGIDPEAFDEIAEELLGRERVEDESELGAEAMEELARAYRALFGQNGLAEPPEQPLSQVIAAVEAAYKNWNSPDIEEQLLSRGLAGETGTALLIQPMIFGNGPGMSGAGRLITRNPASGERALYGKYLPTALGNDLSGGGRLADPLESLFKISPEAKAQLEDWRERLEGHFRDAQAIHFAIEEGRLYLLQAESAPRSGRAGLRIALDMVEEGLITERDALKHLDPSVLEQLLHPVLEPDAGSLAVTRGLPASPGSAVGQVVFFAEQAEELAAQGIKTILVRHETTPEDIGGLSQAEGILTVTGGLTSHAAVVARGMGKCCVVGVGDVELNYHLQEMSIGETTVKRLDWISLDGNTGEVYLGRLPQIQPALGGGVARMLEWADRYRRMGVRANADNAEDAARALELGAEGIGLCRTEHMFFQIDRITLFRKMILAIDHVGRSAALSELLPVQRKDFMDLFRVMKGRPVTIRLLDPPLHEFLPRGIRSQNRMAKAMGVPVGLIQRRTEMLMETNPMLGHRGCRLAITYPEIYKMQVRAIVEAACIVTKEGIEVEPEIMVPLVSTARELDSLRTGIDSLVLQVMGEMGESFSIKVGTMIETPRAAICAGTIARRADFFSFGTNDLTQMSFGFSRDDAGVFLPTYVEKGILEKDPFVELDYAGVGGLMRLAIAAGRAANPDIKLGLCGEHGGEANSVRFCHTMGLDYVSCSPYRVPIARLAAAQAAVIEEDEKP